MDEVIKLTGMTIAQGDIIVIDTGNSMIFKNGVNAMKYLASGFTFFDLHNGSNTIEVSGTGSATVSIAHKDRWL